MKIAVYPGSFDPITNGHLDVIERAVNLFDRVYVAVIKNPDKRPLFSLNERIEMIRKATRNLKTVEVEGFDGLLINYAKKRSACAIIRGLRAVSDFDYEFQMALTNRRMSPKIETIFMMTDYRYSYLSSSLVKQIYHLGGQIFGLVPKAVKEKLRSKFLR